MQIAHKTSRIFSKLRSLNAVQPKFTPVRYSGCYNSPFLEDVEIKTKYTVTSVPEEWKYVERILPPATVPEFKRREDYHSGFKPQAEDLNDRPYFIQRTKNHMLPVYLQICSRGVRRLTIVKKIEGDIWLLGKELEEFLQPMSKKPLRKQINEFSGVIVINGDYVNAVKHYLMKKDY